MEVFFILYKPAVPGNIGAAARAMKTMGFSKLRLISPCDHLSEEARMLAHASNDILENAEVFHSFEEAVLDIDLLIGTTAKKRISKEDYATPAKIRSLLKEKEENIRKAAILFGTEESGLPNKLLLSCDLASTIPLDNPYPSLNLGQAVMLYAYEISALEERSASKEKTGNQSYSELKDRTRELLVTIGIPSDSPLHTRILERVAHLNSTDINLLHSITSRLGKNLNKS